MKFVHGSNVNKWLHGRGPESSDSLKRAVEEIISDVEKRGDEAVLEAAQKFDAPSLTQVEVTKADLESATVDNHLFESIRFALKRVQYFHLNQLEVILSGWYDSQLSLIPDILELKLPRRPINARWAISREPSRVAGVYPRAREFGIGQRLISLDRVGVYVPGGRANYPSSVLMNAGTATVAQVPHITVCSPARKDGTLHPAVLVALKETGVDKTLKVGGATAIAALAGTSGILKKTAADTWALDTNTYITSLALDQLTDVNAATPSNDQVLAWQSSTSEWINKTFSASVATLDSVGDVSAATPSSNQTLQWNGSAWVSSTIVNANVNASAAITYSKLSLSNSIESTDLKDGPAKAGFRSTLNAQTGTSYTLQLTDLAKLVTLDNAGAITLTVPLESSVAFTIGDRIDILQKGTGQVTVAGAVGVTVNSTPGLKLRARWSSATLIKLDTNTWVLIGDLQA